MAIHKFVRMTLEGKPLPFFGDGSTRRDYTYVDDIVDGVVRSIDRCEGYEIYNLGESRTTSLAELVELIGEACGSGADPGSPAHAARRRGDHLRRRDERAKLGYDPHTTVAEGSARFVPWYREVVLRSCRAPDPRSSALPSPPPSRPGDVPGRARSGYGFAPRSWQERHRRLA